MFSCHSTSEPSGSQSLSLSAEFFPPPFDASTAKEQFARNLLHLSPSLGHACNDAAPTSNRSVNMHVHMCTPAVLREACSLWICLTSPPPSEETQEASVVRARSNKSIALGSPSQGSKRIPGRVPGTILCPHDRHPCSSCSTNTPPHPHPPTSHCSR